MLLSGTSGITASTRQPLGVIRDDEDMRAFFYKLMQETIAVGRAAGVEFSPDFPEREARSLGGGFSANDEGLDGEPTLMQPQPPRTWTGLAGRIVALGRKYGIPTPAQEAVYAILKPYRMGRLA